VKPWLQGKVRTGGIVNPNRAYKAAELSAQIGLDAAIAQAHAVVADSIEVKSAISPEMEREILVAPLPSFFN
jgi:hypothetical protein